MNFIQKHSIQTISQPPPLPLQPPPQIATTSPTRDNNDNQINDLSNPIDDELSTCFKSTLAYAGHSSRRLFKLSRGLNLPKRNLLPRMKNVPRGVRYKGSNLRRDSSPTISIGNMKESSVVLTGENLGSRIKNEGVGSGRVGKKGRNFAEIGWKKTKCCVKKCSRCKSVCFKMFLIAINFIFMIFGWALICFGIWIHLNHSSYLLSHLFTINPTNTYFVIDRIPFFLIGLGLTISITSFLGCCGACTESVCFLSFYSIFLSLMVIAELAFGVTLTSLKTQLSQQMHSSLMYQVTNQYNKTASSANETTYDILQITMAWDFLHKKLSCCGVLGPKDFMNTSWQLHNKDSGGEFVPISCCTGVIDNKNNKHGINIKRQASEYQLCQAEALLHPRPAKDFLGTIYTQGCFIVISNLLDGYINKTTILLISLICIQFVNLVLACVLVSWVKKKQSDYWWGDDDECG